MENQIIVPDVSKVQEDMNKPALEVGEYVAVVVKVEPKTNAVKGSYGLNWSLLINANREAVNDGWDAEGKLVPLTYYTYIGKLVDGVVKDTNNSFNTAEMLGAFGLSGTFAPSQVVHRQVIVKVEHRPSLADQEAIAIDPSHVVERMYPTVRGVRAYIVDGIKGPVLQNMADAAAEAADAQGKPAEEF